jgi:hypothetical protein
MQRKLIIGGIVAVVLVAGWALFRPELLFVNQTVHEGFPGAVTAHASSAGTQPVALAEGMFHSVAHRTDGTATIYRLPDGKETLRLSNFATSNGPALYVYLVAAQDARDNATVKRAAFIDLGPLKGNKGDQNYNVPAGTDLDRYRAVTIWCARFSVNFATAPLASRQS